jgi:hypothetical protein
MEKSVARTIFRGVALGVIAYGLSLPSVLAQVSVTTQHNDVGRTGVNPHEMRLKPGTVDATHFGMLFKRVLDDQVYGQPLLVSNVRIRGGTHDVVFVTTVNNSVYAFDANDAGREAPLWHVNFGTPAGLHDAPFGCLDMNGQMGIVGTPVIGLTSDGAPSDALYVVALTRAGGGFEQRLHALDLATGADLPNSPVTINTPGFDPLMQNQRPALMLAAGEVYVGYASHCDKEPYHGYLFSYDATTLVQTGVFNPSPTGEGASIWQSGQAPAIDDKGNVYIATGNGTWDGVNNFSESFIKLDAHLKMLDWFTPTNHELLDKMDMDLDSSGATLIPGTHLIIGGGKQGVLYTVNADMLGHLGDEHAVQSFQATQSHLHSLIVWTSAKRGTLIYVWGQRDRARVYKFSRGKINQTPIMTRPEVNEGHPGAMLSLSSEGGRDGILWAAIHATGDSWHESRPGILHAYEADNIEHELWNSLQNPARDDCGEYAKMAPPTIANGRVFLASFGPQNVGTGQLCVYGLLAGGPVLPKPESVKTMLAATEIQLSWPPVDGALFYSVQSTKNGDSVTLASGLTSPFLFAIPAELGTTDFTVTASNSNGTSEASIPVSVTVEKPEVKEREMVAH